MSKQSICQKARAGTLEDNGKMIRFSQLPEHYARSTHNASTKFYDLDVADHNGIHASAPNRFDANGNFNVDGDCIQMCAKTLQESCHKFGIDNFALGGYFASTKELNTLISDHDKQKMKKGGDMFHVYVVNKKLNKVIDRSQGQFTLLDCRVYQGVKEKQYGRDNVDLFEFPAPMLKMFGVDMTNQHQVRTAVNMFAVCIPAMNEFINLLSNFPTIYKLYCRDHQRRDPEDFAEVIKECKQIQSEIYKK